MVKPREIIIGIAGIEGWSLADRRTWNLLLINAWGDRLEDPTADFFIDLSELRGLHDSNDRVKPCLEKLQRTLVTVTMPDGATRTVQMLGGTDIYDSDRSEGVLKYDFHRKLVPVLRESSVYARMEIKVLSAFTSKYALSLYEVLSSKINLRRTSEVIDVDTLRRWLGVEAGKLGRWPDLNRFALKMAVSEVNALSPFEIEAEPIMRGRKVVQVRLSWSKKEPFSPAEQAAAREINSHKTGRKARIAGTAETPALAFPATGSLKGTTPWDDLARANVRRIQGGHIPDLSVLTMAFRDWAAAKNLPLDAPRIEQTFVGFCKAYSARAQ